jgi:HAE1 family hydrophobic/amphiphilic exporter-1
MKKHENNQPLDGMIISDTAINQPVFITMLMSLLIVVGLLAYSMMPVNLLPDINMPIVTVRVAYPGAGPQSVADQVAQPIEDEMATLSGVTDITSNSSDSYAVVMVEFEDGTDVAEALQNVREKVAGIRSQLPQDIEEPVYERVDPNQDPILTLAITSQSGQDGEAVRHLLEEEIVPRIQRASGVGSTTLTGGMQRQINVQLNLSQMQALGILPSQVSAAINNASTNVGVGDTMVGQQEYNLRTPSVFDTPNAIATVGIPGTSYEVRDVATIEDGTAEVETYSRLNGEDAIILDIRKQTDTNTVAVADAAMEEITAAFASFPDLHYEIIRNDAEQVRKNVDGALEEILVAVLFAMLVVWFFFRDLRNTLITVMGLPVIIIGTFAAIYAFDISINIMSLLALSVSVGLVIDDAIVVRENIFRHMERGEPPRIASSRGTARVATSVLAMTLTIIAVFVPATFTSGITGIILKSFGITVACAMALSLVEAFTMAPMISAYWFKQQEATVKHHVKAGEEHLPDEAHEELGAMERFYEKILDWSLHHRMLVVGIGMAVVLASVYVVRDTRFSFLPTPENHEFGIAFDLPPGSPLAASNQMARQAEEIILADPGVEALLTTVGGSSDRMSGGSSAEHVEFFVKLHEDASTPATRARLRPLLADFPDIVFSLPSYKYGTSTAVRSRPVQVQVRGVGQLEELEPVVNELLQAFQGIEGLYDLDTTYNPGKPEIQYHLKQEVANSYNLTNRDLAMTMRTLIDGATVATYREAGEEYDIVVRLRPEDRDSVEDLGNVQLPLGRTIVPLNSIAEVTLDSSPTTIRRANRQPEILIGGNNIGRNINDVQAEMQAQIDKIALPDGVRVSFAGASEDQQEGFTMLLLAMGLSVLFVYMVLASQFGSYLQPLIIMLAMPLSFIGAFLGLKLRGLEMDITGMIGMLMLLGLVVKNSILLVDFTNALQAAGLPRDEAIRRASAIRLRPILMTSIAILAGNIPAAIGLGEGAELRHVLATVVIGGVLVSTLLTLLLVPVAYSLLQSATARFDQLKHWRPRLRPRRRQQEEQFEC